MVIIRLVRPLLVKVTDAFFSLLKRYLPEKAEMKCPNVFSVFLQHGRYVSNGTAESEIENSIPKRERNE